MFEDYSFIEADNFFSDLLESVEKREDNFQPLPSRFSAPKEDLMDDFIFT